MTRLLCQAKYCILIAVAANQQCVTAPSSIYHAQNFAIAQEKETVREVPQEEQSGVKEDDDDDDDDF